MRPWIALLFVALSLAGCTGGDDCAEWHCRDVTTGDPPWNSVNMAGRTALEMNFPLKPGETLEWDWFVQQQKEVGFEMHYHEDQTRDVTVFQRKGTDEKGSYTTEEAQTYSLLWVNEGTTAVTLWFQLEGMECREVPGGSQCAFSIPI